MQLLSLCSHYNCHKGFTLTTTRCSLQLTQCILNFRARSLMSRTNFIASLRLTQEKQNKNSIKKTSTGCFSFYVYIFTFMFGFNHLSSLTKWLKSSSVKPLSVYSVAIHNRESKVQLVMKPRFHKLYLWKQTFHTSYADRENKKQVKQVNTVGINPFHNLVMFEIIP